MTGKKIIYYLLAAFITGNVVLIYIQYNSAKNINILIDGNEKVLAEKDVSNNLRELNSDIVSVEAKIGNKLYTKDAAHHKDLEVKITEIEADLDTLQKISDDDSSVKYIDVLDMLVREKLFFSRNVADSVHLLNKSTAEIYTIARRSKEINDSVRLVTRTIESLREKLLAKVTSSINKSGKKALYFGTILIVLILMSGAVLFWIIISTIRKQNQLIYKLNTSEKKVKEVAQIKENFMANMSHEIRTPMTAIIGFTNLLQQKNLDLESMAYVKTISKSGEHLLSIINDILDLSSIEAGMIRIESATFNIRSFVYSVEKMFKAKAVDKQLQLLVEIDETLPDTLEGDATRLTQILVNLIDNALKFTSRGSVFVKITNEGKVNNSIKTGIAVSDTGIGIAKEKLTYIFDRFQQAEDSVTRKYGGTGLGLSIVNDLVLLQNGSIAVDSEPGKGTTFHVVIPYKIPIQQITTLPAVQNPLAVKSNFENTTVLVVEDNEINQSLIKHLFKSWELNFDLANNGKKAIEMLHTTKYDLILMDIQMPEMDGYTATQEIRNTLQLNTPIIAMTAHALAGEREKCLGFGMNEYISKPLPEEQLYKLIAQFTQKKNRSDLKKETSAKFKIDTYQYINLQYMQDISDGNIEYEKTVTEQFIEAIPTEIKQLEDSFAAKDFITLKLTAHNMKTTISVMGLNDVLQTNLDVIEYEDLSDLQITQQIKIIKEVCNNALAEANLLLATF